MPTIVWNNSPNFIQKVKCKDVRIMFMFPEYSHMHYGKFICSVFVHSDVVFIPRHKVGVVFRRGRLAEIIVYVE